jgi:ribose transport system ATP-binding protein
MLEVTSLVKEFGPTRALDGLDLSVASGEVHGVIGENGAGKSTLMKILSGIHAPTSGSVKFGGQAVHFRAPIEAERAGIAMIHQELNLVDDLSVGDNIWLGRELRSGPWLNRAAMNAAVEQLLTAVGAPLSPSSPIREVSLANRQLVEIAKAIGQKARLLIMDEPSEGLAPAIIEHLQSRTSQPRSRSRGRLYSCSRARRS